MNGSYHYNSQCSTFEVTVVGREYDEVSVTQAVLMPRAAQKKPQLTTE